MKTTVFKNLVLAVLTLSASLPGLAVAEAAVQAAASVSASQPVPLAPAVADIVKLSQAKVGDSVILAYVQNSGMVYNLDASQIVYLRDTGVSEPVISAMLSQKDRYLQAANAAAQSAASSSAAYQAQAEAAAQQQQVYASEEPAESAPASSVYVIPYGNSSYSYGWPGYGYSYYNVFPFYAGYYPFGYGRYHYGFRSHGFYPRTGFNGGGFRGGFHGGFPGNFRGGFHSGFSAFRAGGSFHGGGSSHGGGSFHGRR